MCQSQAKQGSTSPHGKQHARSGQGATSQMLTGTLVVENVRPSPSGLDAEVESQLLSLPISKLDVDAELWQLLDLCRCVAHVGGSAVYRRNQMAGSVGDRTV